METETGIEKVIDQEIVFPIKEEDLVLLEERMSIPEDCTTKLGYEKAKVNIRELVKKRKETEKHGKKLVERAREFVSSVTTLRLSQEDRFKALEAVQKAPKLAEDNRKAEIKAKKAAKELERIKGIKDAISEMQNLAFMKLDCTPQDCIVTLSTLASIEINLDTFGEFADDAQQVKELTEEKIKEIHNNAVAREDAEEKEEARKKEEADEAERIAKENAKEAERLRKQQEELDAKEAKQKAEAEERKRGEDEKAAKEKADWEAKKVKEQEEWDARVKADDEKREKEDARLAKIAEEQRVAQEKIDADKKALEVATSEPAEKKTEDVPVPFDVNVQSVPEDKMTEEPKGAPESGKIFDTAGELNTHLVDFFCDLGAHITADEIFELAEAIINFEINGLEYISSESQKNA